MKTILENWRKYNSTLNESGLSRVTQHMMEHDCCIMSAFRNDPSDLTKCVEMARPDITPDKNKMKKKKKKKRTLNMERSRRLKALMLSLGFGVTKVKGSYIEDFETPQAVEVSEASLFCVNLKDDPNFVMKMEELGKLFCQDSILIVPKGAKGAYLLGTNNSDFPGLGNKLEVGDFKPAKEAEFMTRVKNRPFAFGGEGGDEDLNESKLETYKDLSRMERMAVKALTKNLI